MESMLDLVELSRVLTAELTVPTTESWRAMGLGTAKATEAKVMSWRNFMMKGVIQ
jgi:hypothetical protein